MIDAVRTITGNFPFTKRMPLRRKADVSSRNLRQPARFLSALVSVFLLSFCSNLHAEAAAQLQTLLEKLRTLRGDFTQEVTDARGRVTQRSLGVFALQRPGKFRWDYQTPYQQQLVADGRKMWIYDADLQQVTIKHIDAQALGKTPALLLSESGALSAHFTIRDGSREDGLRWFEIRPRSDGEFQQIRLGFDADTPQRLEIIDSFGQTTRMRFSNIQRNITLEGKLWIFVPPAGVDVFEERAP